MSESPPIEKACYWFSEGDDSLHPSLEGTQKADIAIVGAGLTGLWTSLFLKQLSDSLDIVIVEQNTAAYGGSGRNAGILSDSIDHSNSLAVKHFGWEEARRLARCGTENAAELIAFIRRHQIDCDLELSGRLLVALNEKQRIEAERSASIAQQLGDTRSRYLDADTTRAEIQSPLYYGGTFFPGGGILHPVKLVRGLKRVAIHLGIRVLENSLVRQLEAKRVITEKGAVQAEKIILATNAFTHLLFPKLLKYFIPLYDYILVSEPLTPAQKIRIGWKNRQGVTDGRTFFNYYRLTADDRILWGTSEAMYYPPNRVGADYDHSERHYRELKRSFVDHFPGLSELQFPYAWGGPIASTTRFTPFFGSFEHGRILYALGYTGHGLGSTHLAGKILAHQALEKPHELLHLQIVKRKPFPYPPEPFRSLAVRAVTRSLRKVDQGKRRGPLLWLLDRLKIGLSS